LRRRDFLKRYVDFNIGRPTTYKLTQRGKKLISLIKYFQEYFRALKLDGCINCKFEKENECIAKNPSDCPYIKSGDYLPFDLDN
jgi:hypothetical protein